MQANEFPEGKAAIFTNNKKDICPKCGTNSDYQTNCCSLKTSLEEYQEWTNKTAIYPKDEPLYYTVLGLVNEAGEVAGVVKKIMRDDNKIVTPEKREKIIAECGDVMWYLARIAQELGFSLEEVIQKNHDKLEDRLARNVIQGSGDNR
jgi:NTP pyrophosphatase (non-canonical NTP hydrolase)